MERQKSLSGKAVQGRELLIEVGCGPGQSGSRPRAPGLRAVRGQVVKARSATGRNSDFILNTAGSRQCAVSRNKTQSDLHLEASLRCGGCWVRRWRLGAWR